jgi:hypothetical protein
MTSAVLVLSRGDDSAGLLRKIVITLDGSPVARLGPGQTVEVSIPAGNHRVIASMDWTTSPSVEIHAEAGERVALQAALPWSGFWKMITSPRSTLTLERIRA